MMTNMMRIEAEGRARGLRGQRLVDFMVGWFRNEKTGTGRRSKEYCKGRVEDGEHLIAIGVQAAKSAQFLRKVQAMQRAA